MILGIGTDLANIDRIAGVLERYGDRFRNRVFTEIEQAKAERRRDVAGTYAKRWSAKEACSKALGTGRGTWPGCCAGSASPGDQPVVTASPGSVQGGRSGSVVPGTR